MNLKNILTKFIYKNMKTLKIEIPSGFEIDNFDIKTGEIKFKETPKDIKEIIKNFADVLKHHRISEEEFEDQIENLERDEIAYRQVKLIVAALNEGWLPDWTNSSEYKYFPWFKMGSSSGSGFSYDGYAAGLRFRLSALAFASKIKNWQNMQGSNSRKFIKVT